MIRSGVVANLHSCFDARATRCSGTCHTAFAGRASEMRSSNPARGALPLSSRLSASPARGDRLCDKRCRKKKGGRAQEESPRGRSRWRFRRRPLRRECLWNGLGMSIGTEKYSFSAIQELPLGAWGPSQRAMRLAFHRRFAHTGRFDRIASRRPPARRRPTQSTCPDAEIASYRHTRGNVRGNRVFKSCRSRGLPRGCRAFDVAFRRGRGRRRFAGSGAGRAAAIRRRRRAEGELSAREVRQSG